MITRQVFPAKAWPFLPSPWLPKCVKNHFKSSICLSTIFWINCKPALWNNRNQSGDRFLVWTRRRTILTGSQGFQNSAQFSLIFSQFRFLSILVFDFYQCRLFLASIAYPNLSFVFFLSFSISYSLFSFPNRVSNKRIAGWSLLSVGWFE